MPLRDTLTATVDRVRRRLALRRAVTGGAYGLLAGSALSVLAVGMLHQVVPAVGPGVWLVPTGLITSAAVAVGIGVQVLRPGLQRNEIAQLLDQRLGTDEAWLTATWLVDAAETPQHEALLAKLESRLDAPSIAPLLAIRWPRSLRLLPLIAAAWLGVVLLPTGWATLPTSAGPNATEAERLAERLAEAEAKSEGAPLPESIQSGLDTLSGELAGEELSAEQAIERIEDLQAQLDAFTDELAPATDLLKDLEEAANALAEQPDLAEALREADLETAAEQLDQLADDVQEMSPDEQERVADGMASAGEQLASSGDPRMQQAGEALEKAAEQLKENAKAAGEGRAPSPAQEAAAKSRMDDLREQVAKAQELGKQLQQDEKALQRAQQTNGALEGSKQRMEGRAEPVEGEAQGTGAVDPNAGGRQEGTTGEQEAGGREGGQGGQDAQGNDGTSTRAAANRNNRHTWEDEGEIAADGKGFNDADRSSERTASAAQHVDDFERLYAPSRLQNADALLAGASGSIDERGEIEIVPTRRTSSDERATRILLDVPDRYAEAAAEAINDESVPAGYRDAVKQYFDQME